ncbi:MAG: hypothetical protein ABIS47_13585 [Acidimicrobiales bacterium]
MRIRQIAGLLLVPAVLAGCSKDTSTATATTSGPASTTPTTAASTSVAESTTTTAAAKDPAKAAKAKAAVLQPADFPSGFKEVPADEALDQEATFTDLTTCLGVTGDSLGKAASPTYRQGIATQTTSTVEYFTDPKPIAMAVAGSPKFAGCVKAALTADLKRNSPPGMTIDAVDVAPLDLPQLGQLTSASRATAPLPGAGTINQDFIIVFKDDSVTRMTFLNPGQPFPAELEKSLVEKVVARA